MSLYSIAPLSTHKLRLILVLFLFIFSKNAIFSQEIISETIKWKIFVPSKKSESTLSKRHLSFEGASWDLDSPQPLPIYCKVIDVPSGYSKMRVEIEDENHELLTSSEKSLIPEEFIKSEFEIHSYVKSSKGKKMGIIRLTPLKLNNTTGKIVKLVKFKLKIYFEQNLQKKPALIHNYPLNSVLASGEWYKIAIPKDGVYQITYQFLKDLGINIENLNPKTINIYGNGLGMLPEKNYIERPLSLQVNNIYISGENDGVFNQNDYILFYANGPHTWTYDSLSQNFVHHKNLYSDYAHYFIGIGTDPPKRIPNVNEPVGTINNQVETFNDYQFHEKDFTNLIESGREWFGEYFDINTLHNFEFRFDNLDLNSTVTAKINALARTVYDGDSQIYSTLISSVKGTDVSEALKIYSVGSGYLGAYGELGTSNLKFTPKGEIINLSLEFIKNDPTAKAWLNYIELNARRKLKMTKGQLLFQDVSSVGMGNISNFNISNGSFVNEIWDVTQPTQVKRIPFNQGEVTSFKVETNKLRKFIAFDGTEFYKPLAKSKVANQNLHSLTDIDYVVVTHHSFLTQAKQLAEFHETKGLKTAVVTNEEVYNEFSSGTPDITAIKDLMKMLYTRAGSNTTKMPQYLLLFGDGSYNYKSLENNTNYVLTYQSPQSLIPTSSYTSDDYFGLLDPDEGNGSFDLVDIGIGRLPVSSTTEAQAAVNKIIHYYTSTTTEVSNLKYGGWKNDICIIADDEDDNDHLSTAERLAAILQTEAPSFNVNKIYLDAYSQISTSLGEKYPQVNQEINNTINKGAFIITYVGHGGEKGWAHEEILDIPTIKNWNNFEKLPLFITATCEFSRFDNPEKPSAGEMVFLNPNGGGIALFTTTRVVYTDGNEILTSNFYASLVSLENQRKSSSLGDLIRTTKNKSSGTGINRRNFMLIGDPAMLVINPVFKVQTTKINSVPLASFKDTIKALSQVTAEGIITDESNLINNNFNGVLFVKIFDKSSKLQTLENDPGNSDSVYFNVQKDVIYQGRVSVKNGKFQFTFNVPKDINYSIGNSKFSYYAYDKNFEAKGYLNNVLVGGSLNKFIPDNIGPKIEVFLNDKNFIDGGNTDENPKLMAELMDDNGINTVGAGIGHNITMLLDNKTDKKIELNDFFESDMDSYQSGKIEYQLNELPEGPHNLKIKAWDIYNNSSESEINFIVVNSENMVLNQVLNYPNPFVNNTLFHFQHNQPNQELNVKIQIFTISGKLVKSINKIIYSNGFKEEGIPWDGRDDFGDKLGRGTYVYKFTVTTPNGKTDHKFEKLVILN